MPDLAIVIIVLIALIVIAIAVVAVLRKRRAGHVLIAQSTSARKRGRP
jgi:hypothetical protein